MTAQTIAVMNVKGGAGKSTTALIVAQVAAHLGLRTVLLDADPQQSQMTWAENASRLGNDVANLTVVSATTDSELEAIFDGYADDNDLIIGDLPGAQTDLAALLIAEASLAVLPARGAYLDVKGVIEAVEYIRSLGSMLNFDPPDCRWLVNFQEATRLRDEFITLRRQVAEDNGFGLIQQMMWQRKAYSQLHIGHTIWSLGKSGAGTKMRAEAEAVGREILSLIFDGIGTASETSASAA